jgi:hypothetical protein
MTSRQGVERRVTRAMVLKNWMEEKVGHHDRVILWSDEKVLTVNQITHTRNCLVPLATGNMEKQAIFRSKDLASTMVFDLDVRRQESSICSWRSSWRHG